MPIPTLTREQCHELDRRATADFGVPSVVLMENAGRGVADKLCELPAESPVAICCGRGNNASDGFVIARHLDLRGIAVGVLLWAEPAELKGDAATNFAIIEKSGISIEIFYTHDDARLAKSLGDTTWIVDALLGTGARGNPRPPFDAVIRRMNESPAPILAVDLPSGLDCDTGEASSPTIRAAHTCTFVAHKPGMLTDGAKEFVGQIHVLDIGAPRALVEEMLR